jgi:hypothetical protein
MQLKTNLAPLLTAVGLGLLFFCLYMALAAPTVLSPPPGPYGFHLVDRFFEADPVYMIEDVTALKTSDRGAHRHPFLTVLTYPIASAVSSLLDGYDVSSSRADRLRWRLQTLFTLGLTNLCLSASIAVCLLFFWRLDRNLPRAALFACFLGVSGAVLIFSIVPEHFAISSFLLCLCYLTFLVCLQTGRLLASAWIALSVLCFAVTSFNIIQPSFLFLLLVYHQRDRERPRASVKILIRHAVIFCGICLVLFAIRHGGPIKQRRISRVDFAYDIGMSASLHGLTHPGQLLSTMLRQSMIAPLVSPLPRHGYYQFPEEQTAKRSLLFFTFSDWSFQPAGWGALILLILLAAHRANSVFREQLAKPGLMALAMAGCLAINLVFHCFYGWGVEMQHRGRIDTFLYSLHWLFPMSYFLFPRGTADRQRGLYILCALTVLLAVNNIAVVRQMRSTTNEFAIACSADDTRRAEVVESCQSLPAD